MYEKNNFVRKDTANPFNELSGQTGLTKARRPLLVKSLNQANPEPKDQIY